MRPSTILVQERAFVEKELGGLPSICTRCGTTLDSFADRCAADLSEACPGFLAIEDAKIKFHRQRKAGEAEAER